MLTGVRVGAREWVRSNTGPLWYPGYAGGRTQQAVALNSVLSVCSVANKSFRERTRGLRHLNCAKGASGNPAL